LAINKLNSENIEQISHANSRLMVRTKGEIKDIEGVTFYYMLNKLNIPQPELLHLNGAKSPARINGDPGFVVRFFNIDKAKAKGIAIKDYDSLNGHPEMIEYEGYYVRGKGGKVIIRRWEGAGSSFLEERINNGEITEVGLEKRKSFGRKSLGRLGRFMIMGGFVVVLILGVVLVLLISMWAKSC
jgi:hypothetical protein